MFTTRTACVVAICAALAACDEPTRIADVTAPQRRSPAFDEIASPLASTPYDASDLAFEATSAELVEAQQAATGGRATGHHELAAPIINRVLERKSFTALSTDPAPTAKGEVELKTLFTTGQESKVHLNVDCLVIVGNQAWFSGPARRFVLDGVEQPPGLYLVFRVQDNGEGANAPPDLGSPAFSGPPMACMLQPLFVMTPTANGNIQVRQR
jgi:hypothetical protein